jgi:hypothetical protein
MSSISTTGLYATQHSLEDHQSSTERQQSLPYEVVRHQQFHLEQDHSASTSTQTLLDAQAEISDALTRLDERHKQRMSELLLQIDAMQAEYNRDRHHLSLQLLKSMQKSNDSSNSGISMPTNLTLQALLGTGVGSTLSDAQLALLIPPPPPLFPGFYPFHNGASSSYPFMPHPASVAAPPPAPIAAAPIQNFAHTETMQGVQIVAGPDGRHYQMVMTPEGPKFIQVMYQQITATPHQS